MQSDGLLLDTCINPGLSNFFVARVHASRGHTEGTQVPGPLPCTIHQVPRAALHTQGPRLTISFPTISSRSTDGCVMLYCPNPCSGARARKRKPEGRGAWSLWLLRGGDDGMQVGAWGWPMGSQLDSPALTGIRAVDCTCGQFQRTCTLSHISKKRIPQHKYEV